MVDIYIAEHSITQALNHAVRSGVGRELGEAIALGFVETMKSAPRHDPLAEAVRALNKDPHDYSTRGCPTCSSMTAALGEPFGCVAKAQRRKEDGHG